MSSSSRLVVLAPSSQPKMSSSSSQPEKMVESFKSPPVDASSKRRKSSTLEEPPSTRTRSKSRRFGPPATPIEPIMPLEETKEEERETECSQQQQQQPKNEEEREMEQHPCGQEEATVITAQVINDRIKKLFCDDDAAAVTQPCLSARIFACFALHLETTLKGNEDAASAVLQSLLPFLRSLVLSELVSLRTSTGGDESPRNLDESATLSSDMKTPSPPTPSHSTSLHSERKIHFSGFDCSSTQPPIDRVDGSAGQHQDSIDALRHVVDMVQSLVTSKPKAGSAAMAAMSALIDFLDQSMTEHSNKENPITSSATNSPTGLKLQQLCAMSIAPTYHHRRIAKAVAMYANECKIVMRRIQQQSSSAGSVVATVQQDNNKLLVERRLAEFVGQAIRFQLRHLFNPAPPRLTPKDTGYEEWSKSYSQVHELVTLTDCDGDYVSGERITSLFNLALDYLCEHFGLERLLDVDFELQPADIPPLFCTKPATNRSLPARGTIPALTPDEIADVEQDITEATSFLAAARACRFLHTLLSMDSVRDEIERRGGWSEVETYASMSFNYQLWKICREDKHLVLLYNFDTLFQKIERFGQVMKAPAESAHDSLAAIPGRFRTATKSKNLLTKYPEIPIIAAHWTEAMDMAVNALPTVDEASPDDDDDEEEESHGDDESES